jgi:hypothetical protein
MGAYRFHLLPESRLGIIIVTMLLLAASLLLATRASTQVLFDFDAAPIHTSLPVDQTVGGITAHLSATGQGFSIQPANTMGFTPAGFGGLCVYPSSVFAADLVIGFSVAVNDFSIMFAPQELGCDDSALMRVTAYMSGAWQGSAMADWHAELQFTARIRPGHRALRSAAVVRGLGADFHGGQHGGDRDGDDGSAVHRASGVRDWTQSVSDRDAAPDRAQHRAGLGDRS